MPQLRALLPLPAVPRQSGWYRLTPPARIWTYFPSNESRCSVGGLAGIDLPELGVTPLVDPGTDVEDERPTPVGSPSPVVDGAVPLSTPSGVDMELAQVFLEVGVLPAMVTPVVEPEGESAMTQAQYPVPPILELSVVEAASPVRPAVGSPARDESLLAQISPSASVAQAFSSPKSPVLRSTPADSPPSELAAMDQYLPWSASLQVGESMDSPLLPAPLTPRRMIAGQFASGAGVSSPTGETVVAGCHLRMPDLSREGPFDVLRDRPDSGASPRMLDGVRGCQYRMTSYDEESGGPDFMPAYGIQLHGCWNTWVCRSRLDYSAIVRNIGSITWVMKRCLRPRSNFNMTRPHTLQCAGAAAIRHCLQQDVVRGHADRIRSEAVSGGCYTASGAVVPGSSGGTLYGSCGLVMATSYSGNSGTPAVSDM